MRTNVPGIDIVSSVLSTNNEKTFKDSGSGFDGLLAQMVERMTLNH